MRIATAATLLCWLTLVHGWVGLAPVHQHRCRSGRLASMDAPRTSRIRRRHDAGERGRESAARSSPKRMSMASNGWAWGKMQNGKSAPSPAAQQAFGSGKELKLGVLLLNLGGPERQEDVEPFLYNLFADPDIIRLPKFISFMQGPIAKVLSARRAPQSKSAYESIGGGSPIVTWTNAQAEAIASELEGKGLAGAKCYVGMRYWHPFTEAALEAIEKDGITALVILPLYPQFSISTSGSSLRVLNEEFTRRPEQWGHKNVAHTVVSSYHDRPGYVNAMADLVAKEVAQFTPEQRQDGVQVLFSAHGVPKSYIDAGDPYKTQIESCVKLISEKVNGINASGGPGAKPGTAGAASGSVSYHLSYQSRVGPVEWLQPYTDAKIQELAEKGSKNLVVVPVSFVSEHIETLEEIDMEYREVAEEAGIVNWRRVPALNTDPAFIKDMADMVVEALSLPTLTVSEAFTRNNCDRKEPDLLERLLEGTMYGVPKSDSGNAQPQPQPQENQSGVAKAMSAVGGAAFTADGVAREIVSMFPSDGIFS